LKARRFDGPATLITGSLSDYVTPADSAAFVEQFPRTQTVEIDGAGHWVHADQPAGFLAALGLVPAIAARAHAPTPADVQRSVLMFPWRRPA
jgi:pimeloyl-ACP methyl ester carboxylesterase